MAFQLSGLLGSKNTGTVSAGRGARSTASSSPAPGGAGQGLKQLQEMKPGQTFSGEVIAKNGSEVQIRLEGDSVVTARLERDMNLALGEEMTFEVKSNTSKQLALRPVYDSQGFDANGVRALQAAALPVSQRTLAMVTALMEQGMGIDKKTLLSIYKDMMTNPGSSPEDVVALHKLKLPVDGENLRQIEGYRNFEHQLTNGIDTVAGQIKDTLLAMVKGGGSPAEAVRLVQDLVRIFAQEEAQAAGSGAASQEGAPGTGGLEGDIRQGTAGQAGQGAEGVAGKVIITEDGFRMEQAAGRPSGDTGTTVLSGENGAPGKTAGETAALIREAGGYAGTGGSMQNGGAEEAATPGNAAAGAAEEAAGTPGRGRLFIGRDGEPMLTPVERHAFAGQLEEAGLPQRVVSQVRSGTITPEQLLHEIAGRLTGGSGREALASLIGGKGMQLLLRGQIEKNWLLSPEKVASREEVDKLYTRLREQSGKLEQALASAGKENGSLGKSLQNIRENVDFMQQLNQNFTYLQLPLKMMTQNAHGDLYVYTNKKNLAKKDGNVSALLHLDMDNLGALDIYVSLQRQRVSTKFYLQKEELLDFMEANIHILNERLLKRGYTMDYEVLHKEEKANVVKEMMKQEGEASMLSMFSFDVRA